MVSSMAGFAHTVGETTWGTLVWELRSVNHRYLELSLRLPEQFRAVEPLVRERLQAVLGRGKVEAQFRFIPGNEVSVDFVMNEPLIAQLSGACAIVQGFFPTATVNALSVLQWPGVLEVQPAHREAMSAAVLQLLDQAIDLLVASKRREGQGLAAFLQMCLQKTHEFVTVIRAQLPRIQAQAQERLLARFAALSLEVDRNRLEQELLLLLQKMDVAEELQRLTAHLEEMARILESDEPMGRRLDFLLQELNREANTLGSKSINSEVTQQVVEIKVLIEQMREQVQNIE